MFIFNESSLAEAKPRKQNQIVKQNTTEQAKRNIAIHSGLNRSTELANQSNARQESHSEAE